MNKTQYRKQQGRTKGECTWCGKQVPTGLRRWCNDNCLLAYEETHDPAAMRWRIWQRDKGVCAVCDFDAKYTARLIRQVRNRTDGWETYRHLQRFYRTLGFHELVATDLWEMDHIKPRVLGGGHELENLRTLCVACHKAETARLAAERAEARRIA